MSIATEIQRIKANIENAYTKAEEKGATIPTTKNSENLAMTIESIETGGTVSTQEKTATPTKNTQNITPDTGYYLSKVVVNPIPSEYIIPSGSIDITANGTYDITNHKSANINVPIPDGYIIPTGSQDITENGTYDITDKSQVVVNVASSGESTLKKLLDYTKSCYNMFRENASINVMNDYFQFNDTSNVTNMSYMFWYCSNLVSVPLFDTSKVTNMAMMFFRCTQLRNVPQFDTSKVTNMSDMFNGCPYLETLPQFDMIKTTNASNMFNACSKLTNLTLLNIKVNLQVGSGTSFGHLLTLKSLIGLCQQCVNVNASRTLTVGTANMTKLADVYIKFTDSSQTTIATNEKGENMVQCESTDTGAMTISQYMLLKNWTLA